MSRTTENIIRLINAGGNLSVNCEGKTTDNILKIIHSAQSKNTKLTLRNLEGHTTENIIRIIQVSGDSVMLEI